MSTFLKIYGTKLNILIISRMKNKKQSKNTS